MLGATAIWPSLASRHSNVTLSPDGVDPTGESPFYAEAARTLNEWMERGEVRIDQKPALYLLRPYLGLGAKQSACSACPASAPNNPRHRCP